MTEAEFVGGPEDGRHVDVPDPPPRVINMSEMAFDVEAMWGEKAETETPDVKVRRYEYCGINDRGVRRYRYQK